MVGGCIRLEQSFIYFKRKYFWYSRPFGACSSSLIQPAGYVEIISVQLLGLQNIFSTRLIPKCVIYSKCSKGRVELCLRLWKTLWNLADSNLFELENVSIWELILQNHGFSLFDCFVLNVIKCWSVAYRCHPKRALWNARNVRL